MVQLTENEGSNQQRGDKRPFSNAGDDNQGGRNPRGDQGGKFQRRSFGDRGPFNKGGDRPFNNGNRFNRGGPFNKDNNFNRGRNQNFGQGRDNQNFNRGRNNQNFQGRNNQNFRQGGFQNNRFNKSWEGNKSDNAPDFEQNDNVTKHKKFDEEIEIEETANMVDTQPKHKKSKNVEQNEDETSSSDSDQEVEISLQKSQKTKENEQEEETSSESEEDIETNANLQKNQNVSKNEDVEDETSSESEEEIETVSKTVQKVNKNEDEETSSSEDEEETVTNSNNVQNNQSKDKIEANNSDEQQMEMTTAEANTSTEKQNGKTKNNSVASRTVFVSSLPASTTEQQIQKFFERYGKIECITFKTIDEFARVAIVFKKEEDAEKAEEVNGMMYKNHRLNVFIRNDQKTKDTSMSIFANVPNDITREDLWDAFESTYGPIRDIVLPPARLDRNGHRLNRGYAIINFHFVDSKELAVTDKQITIKGKIIKVTQNVEPVKPNRTPRVYNGRIQKFEPKRFTGGPRYSNGPRRFSGPRNSYEPRDFAGGPGNIKVHNTPGNSITISLGNDSFQGRPSFNGRPKFNPRNSFKGRRQ